MRKQAVQGGYLLSQAHRLASNALDEKLADHGVEELSGSQGRVFYVLRQSNGLCLGEIAKRTGLPKATLTGTVDRMERAGIVRREAVPGDRRKQCVVLTDTADTLAKEYDAISAELTKVFYRGFSSEEAQQLEAYLKRIINNYS